MARRKSRYITMVVHKHGCLWWLLVGWWWRPIQYLFWFFMCAITGCGLKKQTFR